MAWVMVHVAAAGRVDADALRFFSDGRLCRAQFSVAVRQGLMVYADRERRRASGESVAALVRRRRSASERRRYFQQLRHPQTEGVAE
jgi:hypothetical protein